MKGPQFLVYLRPLVEVLRNIGGSGSTSDVIDQVIDYMNIPEEVVSETIASGASRVRNQIEWARMYLVKADLMDSSQRGIWKLTEKGYEADISDDSIYSIFKKVQALSQKSKQDKQSKKEDDIDDTVVDDEAHGEVLLSIIKNLSPSGFEKL
ncbi:MAG: winged helix-turn-helix domain-containing protein, partial [Chromatiales bacterium]|nr:winged helix-turn-helix domain-containing protein [Chromatiales bacterium]